MMANVDDKSILVWSKNFPILYLIVQRYDFITSNVILLDEFCTSHHVSVSRGNFTTYLI